MSPVVVRNIPWASNKKKEGICEGSNCVLALGLFEPLLNIVPVDDVPPSVDI